MRRPRRLLALDFDGCLNSRAYLLREPGAFDDPNEARALDPLLVAHLTDLLERSGAQVVLSTSWRHGRTPRTLLNYLVARGLPPGLKARFIGSTPEWVEKKDPLSKREYGERGDEIQAFLDSRGFRAEQLVILDDDSDMAHLAPRLVQTDGRVGLTAADVARALALWARRTPRSP